MSRKMVTIDGNMAAATVAHATNEVCAIYPITPSSDMGQHADEFSAAGRKNIWGTIPVVAELQSEGGASGAVHGSLAAGAVTSTFTASQGLLLMIPNMYKIAAELTPTVFHVAARSLACQALSIFGDHSDITAVRETGYGLVASGSVQEVMDMALITQAASFESRIPFIHFFDGFRTSHEILKVEELTMDDMRALIDEKYINEHRRRAMSPDNPTLRGTSQNPDVYFQGRETVNRYYEAVPGILQKYMDEFKKIVGREYKLYQYFGSPKAEKVIVIMGSGAETTHETVEYLMGEGEKVGVLKIRMFRPFSVKDFVKALPGTVKSIAVLDRTKEPGGAGEPLYLDVLTAVAERVEAGKAPFKKLPKIIGGRYGLSSKEFTPAMVKAVFEELDKEKPKNHFTVGINDDVTKTSLKYNSKFSIESDETFRGIFYGLGSDGTVGANKNSIKIIGTETENWAQGYFVYDSKKAGAVTVSHLRFGKKYIRSPYLISKANFVACHQWFFLEQFDILEAAEKGATFLLNSPYGDATWQHLPCEVQDEIIKKKLKVYVINAVELARETGMGAHINTIMQTAFFAISGILPRDEAIAKIKDAIKKTYGAKGEAVVKKNFECVDATLAGLKELEVPSKVDGACRPVRKFPESAPQFVKDVVSKIMLRKGDDVPVSLMPDDGVFPTATTQYEKRNIALDIPEWDPNVCVQCGMCSYVCPHASIRIKAYPEAAVKGAPTGFKTVKGKAGAFKDFNFTVQIAPEDCTGCGLCVHVCPGRNKEVEGRKAINMTNWIAREEGLRDREKACWDFFLNKLPETDESLINPSSVKGSQLRRPLFEFSGACAGCGETPYIKLATQLFGDRMVIANATGCSSIYGGNLPTTPYCKNADGRGPAWNNSLFEDAAEIGFGNRLAIDKLGEQARELLERLSDKVGKDLAQSILGADQSTQDGIVKQRERVAGLKKKLAGVKSPEAERLHAIADTLVQRSVWIFGGDGWAYDIGYGGLDHVLASGKNVNVLVLDTEVYSNTGGQCSKSTPRAATAKFAAAGKPMPKKDLGMIAMTYGNIYVAKVAMGANQAQTVKAFVEAENYPGCSLIIAYSHCIAHGIDMTEGMDHQKAAVESGHWPLFRFDPRRIAEGQNPLQLDSKTPTIGLKDYAYSEVRYNSLARIDAARAEELIKLAQQDVSQRFRLYEQLAAMKISE